MPLSNGTGEKAREKNIKTEIAAGKPTAQAVAIGYAKQRENAAKKGGDDVKTDLMRDIQKDVQLLIRLIAK